MTILQSLLTRLCLKEGAYTLHNYRANYEYYDAPYYLRSTPVFEVGAVTLLYSLVLTGEERPREELEGCFLFSDQLRLQNYISMPGSGIWKTELRFQIREPLLRRSDNA